MRQMDEQARASRAARRHRSNVSLLSQYPSTPHLSPLWGVVCALPAPALKPEGRRKYERAENNGVTRWRFTKGLPAARAAAKKYGSSNTRIIFMQ